MSEQTVVSESPVRRKRKPRPRPLNSVERRLMAGACIMKTVTQDASLGVIWTFTDTGRTARADLCNKLLNDGKLASHGDGLFGDAQTYGWAA